MNLYISENHNPAFHLALEEALFSATEEEFLLFYVNQPSVIMGCNQVLQNEVNVDYCRSLDIGIYRRMTGGGTVYHDAGNLNYSFIVNKTSPLAGMGGQFLQPVIHALHQLGVSAFQGKRKDLWIPGDFKISGTASHLKGMREIHHGTLLFDSDLEQLQLAIQSDRKNPALKGVASVPSPVMNIKQFISEQGLPVFEMHDFIRMISNACSKYCEAKQIEKFPNQILHKALEIADLKYTSEAWNLRK
jgi:lipoate---protein ligase